MAFHAGFLQRSVFLVHAGVPAQRVAGEVDGFVLGGPPAALVRCRLSLLRDYPHRCALDIARRPRLWLRALRSLCKLIGGKSSSLLAAAPPGEFHLLSIAVDPRAARRGVGTALVRGFEDAVRGKADAYRLNVVKGNAAALRFYEKLAFQRVGETATSWTLRKVLSPKVAAAARTV